MPNCYDSNTTNLTTDTIISVTFDTANKYVDRSIDLKIKLEKINLSNEKNPPDDPFILNDGTNDWHWSIDSNGNVLVY